ncbi:hypothetical protein [Candidatus Chloroploca sp. Khr17]|uniref:hypothetical protein n=1 Tax=Candidatus Chloroploca sp. Khr17 TaxID=2496869 RepID=UPI00101C5F64|nr:hypothetical protein [Candidatus Chloroploca sp. Khr17]
MRRIRLMLFIGLCSYWLLLVSSAQAQGSLTATPMRISAGGVTGERLTRTTVIRATTPITGLQGLATDLISDQGQVIPAPQITIQTSATQVAAGQVLTVTTTFDLQGSASGAYQGELLLTSANDVLSLPVTVQVKHPWGWALAVLLLGIVGGGMLTYYRQQVRPYDDILIRAGRLRSQVRTDLKLVKNFQEQIERLLMDVESALQRSDLEQARDYMGKAEHVWQYWRRDRVNWQEQFDFMDELNTRIASSDDSSAYIRKVEQNLKDAARDAVLHPEKFDEFAGRLKGQEYAFKDYQTICAKLQDLLHQSINESLLSQRVETLKERLSNLDPNDNINRNLLKKDLQALADEIRTKAPGRTIVDDPLFGGALDAQPGLFSFPNMPTFAPINTSEAHGQQASSRRFLELWLSSGFLILLLALVGLGQLYGNTPTFGANPWADYATLLAWGFGIEASRSAITGLGSK